MTDSEEDKTEDEREDKKKEEEMEEFSKSEKEEKTEDEVEESEKSEDEDKEEKTGDEERPEESEEPEKEVEEKQELFREESFLANPYLPYIVAGGLLIVLLILLFQQTPYLTSSPSGADGDIVATVNNKTITESELEAQYARLPRQYTRLFKKEDVLKQMVEEYLVLDKAEELGITVSEEQVDKRIQSLLKKGNMEMAQLKSNLQKNNITMEEFRELIKRQTLVEKTFQQIFGDQLEITDEEARTVYEENKSRYKKPRQAKVKHILLAGRNNSVKQKAEKVKMKAVEGEDFCNLVRNYSVDTSSIGRCGEYNFTRGDMMPAFENTSFSLEEGEIGLAKTAYGYHVIKKIGEISSEQLAFKEAKESIKMELKKARKAKLYKELVNDLKADAEIEVNYGNLTITPAKASSEEKSREAEESDNGVAVEAVNEEQKKKEEQSKKDSKDTSQPEEVNATKVSEEMREEETVSEKKCSEDSDCEIMYGVKSEEQCRRGCFNPDKVSEEAQNACTSKSFELYPDDATCTCVKNKCLVE